MLECHRLAKSPTDTVKDVLKTHAQNMKEVEKWCKSHDALVKVLKTRENK